VTVHADAHAPLVRHRADGPVVVLSPHLDDAVLDCWSLLTSGARVAVVNVFAGIPPAGATGAWDRVCGEPNSPAQVRRRRAEDGEALARLGIVPANLDFLDAQYRPPGTAPPWREIDAAVAEHAPEASLVVAPAALGKANRDHLVVREYAFRLWAAGVPLRLSADVPYCVQHGWPAWVAADGDGHGRDVDAFWAAGLAPARALGELRPSVTRLSAAQAAAKLAVMRLYRTQFAAIDAQGIGLLRNPYVHGVEVAWSLTPACVPPAGPPAPLRELRFLDGSAYPVEEDLCRGCFMNEHEPELPRAIRPVYDDGAVVVRQDAEWPVPGFYIVSTRAHVGSIGELDDEQFARFFAVLRAVRHAMRAHLGIARVQMYHEEKIARPHLHVWLLPLWPDVMRANTINPRVYEGNIKEYLNLFSFREAAATILAYNQVMARTLGEQLRPARRAPGRVRG
jgi:diadenosine tetraphosphate (Ap4A) HIT family hydrolase